MRVDGKWSFHQTNDAQVTVQLQQFTLASGTERVVGTAWFADNSGQVNGTVSEGRRFEFHIDWSNGHSGRYRGGLGVDGKLAGTCWDVTAPDTEVLWFSDRTF